MTLTDLDNLCKEILEKEETEIIKAAEKFRQQNYYLVKPKQ